MLEKITKGLLSILIIELVLAGGGRIVSFGPVSLRMILFSAAMIITAIHIIKGSRIEKRYVYLQMCFTAMLAAGIIIGAISGADKSLIWEDVKPLLYFYLLPFFSVAISGIDELKQIQKSIIVASAFMAAAFIIILVLVNLKLIPFLDFYVLTFPTEEFFYRGEYTFFYKGFVYLCVGFLLVHFSTIKNKWWLLSLFACAILLSFTRGLLFALALTYLSYFVIEKKYPLVALMFVLGCSIFFYGKTFYSTISDSLYRIDREEQLRVQPSHSNTLFGDREHSDNVRKKQIKEVFESVTIASVLYGHGFGHGVSERPIHMEISYLEIFHKQGLIGIGCWCFLFIRLVQSFLTASKRNLELSLAFFLSALFIFFQSITNQYINNPIGLGMFMISLTGLGVINKSPNVEDK